MKLEDKEVIEVLDAFSNVALEWNINPKLDSHQDMVQTIRKFKQEAEERNLEPSLYGIEDI